MKKKLAAVCVVLLLAIGFFYVVGNRSDSSAGNAPPLSGAPSQTDQLTRGEYLAKAADCVACHTDPATGRQYAGGFAFRLPFGTIYSSNITPDPETGIGKYSDDEFVRAVREGIRRDGAHLYPAFPYTSYTELSRADVLAIKAYLFSLPPVKAPARANDLGFPFNQRWAMGFWNAAFFKNHRFEADPSKPAQWNSGAYLATALGHCGECHTPRNIGFGLSNGDALAGQELQGWWAYNITSDPAHGIGAWSDADLHAYISTGHAPGRASASGPMGEAVYHSLQYLKSEDVDALVAFLRDVPARTGKHPIDINPEPAPALAADKSGPGAATPLDASLGGTLFAGACASCHQWNGDGRQDNYAALRGTRGVNDASGANVVRTILEGAHYTVSDHQVFMPAFGEGYTNTEVAALANYVISQFGGKEGTVTPDAVAHRRSL
jgi:mono/diheme cytochrome c family protein